MQGVISTLRGSNALQASGSVIKTGKEGILNKADAACWPAHCKLDWEFTMSCSTNIVHLMLKSNIILTR